MITFLDQISLLRRDTFSVVRECSVEATEDSSITCRSDLIGIDCDVYCNNTYEGTYHCSFEKGWEAILPDCRTPTGEF